MKAWWKQKQTKTKHGNEKVTKIVNGSEVVFDSIKEAKRFDELYTLLRAKRISNLKLQPEFLLQDTQYHHGKTYPKVKYIADFQYEQDGKTIVEDAKSEHTSSLETFRVKIKWFLSIYGDKVIFKEII